MASHDSHDSHDLHTSAYGQPYGVPQGQSLQQQEQEHNPWSDQVASQEQQPPSFAPQGRSQHQDWQSGQQQHPPYHDPRQQQQSLQQQEQHASFHSLSQAPAQQPSEQQPPPPGLPPRRSATEMALPGGEDRSHQMEVLQSYEMSRGLTEDEQNQALLQREFPALDSSLIAAIYGDSGSLSATREMLQELASGT